jgi:ABC-type glycerol-3-phosphate transport system substrate-binding protein
LRLGVVECPYRDKRVFHGYGRATLLNKYSPRRQQALDFMVYMAGKEYNDLVNHQADGIAPVTRYCYTPEFLHDPEYPEEDYNAVWREIMGAGEPDYMSQFVNAQTATRIFKKQIDLVKNDQKPVADAMRDAAREVNQEIAKTLEMDPALRIQYYRLTGRERPQ